jgi:hypothetical protein
MVPKGLPGEHGVVAELLRQLPAARVRVALPLDVVHMDRLPFGDGAPGQRLRRVRKRFGTDQGVRAAERHAPQEVAFQDVQRSRGRIA